MPSTPPRGTYLVDKVIVTKRGKAKRCTRLRHVRNAIGNDINLEDLTKNTIIVDYSINDEAHCSSGVVAPHKDGKSKLAVVAILTGTNGTLLEQRGKLMFQVD